MTDERELLEKIIGRSQDIPVLIDFWAPWCQPCKTLGPILEKLEKEADGAWELFKVDVDECQNLAMQFGIQSIPNVKLVHKGKLINELAGAASEAEVRKWLDQHIPKPPMSEIDQAKALIQAERHKKAGKLLERVLAADPDSDEARVLLAKCVVFDRPGELAGILSPIKQDSKFFEVAGALGNLASLLELSPKKLPESSVKPHYGEAITALKNRKFEAALDAFFEVLIRDRNYQDDGARKSFIAIFEYLGRNHPISKSYARRFEMAVFS